MRSLVPLTWTALALGACREPDPGIELAQRKTADVPAVPGVRLSVGDISLGQTTLTVTGRDGVIASSRVRPGDELPFVVDGRGYVASAVSFDERPIVDTGRFRVEARLPRQPNIMRLAVGQTTEWNGLPGVQVRLASRDRDSIRVEISSQTSRVAQSLKLAGWEPITFEHGSQRLTFEAMSAGPDGTIYARLRPR